MKSLIKAATLITGIGIGVLLTLGALKVVSHVQRTGALLPASLVPAADAKQTAGAKKGGDKQQTNELKLSKILLKPTARLGQVTFAYTFTSSNKSADAGMQLFIEDKSLPPAEAWQTIAPNDTSGQPLVLHLYRDIDTTGTFTVNLPKGKYGGYRLILFASPDGKNIDVGHSLYDTVNDPKPPAINLNLTVVSDEAPVTNPVLAVAPLPKIETQSDGNYTITIPAKVKVPMGYQAEGNGFWVMAKGTVGFAQVWAAMSDAKPGGNQNDPHQEIPVVLQFKDMKPGLWNAQFGLFKYSWGPPLQWIYPGINVEAGGDAWVRKAPEARIPPRLTVKNGQFQTLNGKPHSFYGGNPAARQAASFIRGGNYGNAITWTDQPELDTPGYFTLLSDMGCKYVRFNFNPDRYAGEPEYQHSVDQIAQNIWAAGLYPLLAPQDLPSGSTRSERVANGLKVVEALARKYQGRSVWLEVCNEPKEFDSWASWKPVAEEYVKAIRAIDPDAFVIVPFEGYSKDGRGAAASPITATHVDLYDGHAYVQPNQVATLFGTPAKAGLPVLIGEYGSNDTAYLRQMNKAFQALPPGVLALSPWAFTIKGQDSLPLVADGSTATLRYTSTGQVIADDFAKWDSGKKVE